MRDDKDFQFGTLAIHGGQTAEPVTGAVMTPIFQTSTYAQHSPGKPIGQYEYSRTANPTRTALEANLASLEQGRYGLCFGSGCAALSAVLHTLSAGDHVLVSDDVYGGTFRIFDQVFAPLGLTYTQVDMTDLNAITDGLKPETKLVWLETPSNPLLKVVDIAQIAKAVKSQQQDTLVAVDNTFATPYLQNPLLLGADIVCHSTTKYIGGHSDVVGGALIVNDQALADKLYYIQNAVGAVPGPQDCFLQLRSTKTLHVRMQRHCENAKAVSEFLAQHSKVEEVIYPGLASHPQHEIATKQMRDFGGGMVSVVLKGGESEACAFLERVKLFTLAESLGGVESLIEHPAIMTHAAVPKEIRESIGIRDSLVRLSVGIEGINDLLADLEQAL